MAKIYCFAHPDYDSKQVPILSCKTCCGLYIQSIKEDNQTSESSFNAYEWIAEKTGETKQAKSNAKS